MEFLYGYSKIKLVNVTAEPVSGVKAWLYLRWLPRAPSSRWISE